MFLQSKSFFVLALLLVLLALPSESQAQYNNNLDNEGESGWEGEEEREQIRGWRRYSSALREAIDALPDTTTQFLPMPVIGVAPSTLTQNFGDSRGGGTRTHEGLDIMAARGTPVASPTEAVVLRTGNGGNAGVYIYTANPGGETFAYMHLDSVASGIDQGTKLSVGQVIGYVGNTGNASGGAPHLHFEVRNTAGPTDPYPRLTGQVSTISSSPKVTNLSATRDLTLGNIGEDVRRLQKYLNANGYPVATTGAGSPGNETTYFGPLTQKAVAAFQKDHSISPSVGYFGPKTLAFIGKSNLNQY